MYHNFGEEECDPVIWMDCNVAMKDIVDENANESLPRCAVFVCQCPMSMTSYCVVLTREPVVLASSFVSSLSRAITTVKKLSSHKPNTLNGCVLAPDFWLTCHMIQANMGQSSIFGFHGCTKTCKILVDRTSVDEMNQN
ncbi:hypothetical protein AKJ16_DCAP20991, partial [Drosera capensis]